VVNGGGSIGRDRDRYSEFGFSCQGSRYQHCKDTRLKDRNKLQFSGFHSEIFSVNILDFDSL